MTLNFLNLVEYIASVYDFITYGWKCCFSGLLEGTVCVTSQLPVLMNHNQLNKIFVNRTGADANRAAQISPAWPFSAQLSPFLLDLLQSFTQSRYFLFSCTALPAHLFLSLPPWRQLLLNDVAPLLAWQPPLVFLLQLFCQPVEEMQKIAQTRKHSHSECVI